jgi:cyanophycinase
MSEPDLCALRRAGGVNVRVAILPTAAAPDNNDRRAGANALRWFRSLGALQAEVVPVIDTASANDPSLAERLRLARLIYMLGGFPHHLGETLRLSRVWDAAVQAYEAGAVLGGSSAGAMVLCAQYYDPESEALHPGLGLLPDCCVLPHHNTFGRAWAKALTARLPASTLIGIDEQTGILGHPSSTWTVHGAGRVTLYRSGQSTIFARGETFSLSEA